MTYTLSPVQGNFTPILTETAQQLCSGDSIVLAPGRYDCYPEGAYIGEYYISNNDGGIKPIALLPEHSSVPYGIHGRHRSAH